jgi:trigger factor
LQTQDLHTETERVGKDRVKLRVEVPEEALQPAVADVYRDLSSQMKVPGFRKGKVPRQVIDSRVGPDFVRSEALKEALPEFYRRALRAEELEAINTPDIDIVSFDRGSPIVFEATVDVLPPVVVPDLSAISIEAPSSEVTDAEVDEQLERLRDRFAELETAGREARRGDFVLIDLKGYRHDELIEGASAPDLLYELGSRTGPPKLDAELEGNRPGAILKFTDTVAAGPEAGQELSFTVLVKEVKAKKLPALDDDFAKTAGEFDNLDDLKADLRTRMAGVKKTLVADEIRARALAAVVATADFEVPDSLVEGEFTHRLGHFEDDLERAGVSMADYLRETESTELEVRSELRSGAARSVKAELLLEQIAREQEFEVTEEDVGREVAMAAAQSERDPNELLKELVASGRLQSVAADIMRRKALDYVADTISVENRPGSQEESDSSEVSGAGGEANPR